ncbi:hypothetical protein HY641_03330 [Candidatus Woesearchaeota archaeon]|nr:hypothetical protein [Candidatus Woesearchaeota archaeon]
MAKTMILYDLNDKTQPQKNQIIRTLFGYQDKSCHGKYLYQRPGLLSKIPFNRKTKTALIIPTSEKEKVTKILHKLAIKTTALDYSP